MTREGHDRAVQSLNAALVEQDRLSERYDAASGTSTELGAYVRLRAAGDQVAARGAWLSWIDDEGYRGLNAGPFALLEERTTAIPDRCRSAVGAARWVPSGRWAGRHARPPIWTRPSPGWSTG